MMKCRWWDSNPHGFPNDFESFASAIPPHRLIFNFETLVPVSEDWRDVKEGCKKSCFDELSKFNEYSWISRTDTKNHEADYEWFISNELFHYHDPAHAAIDPDNLWMAAQAIRNQSVLEIEYQKLKDHQIVKRTIEPVGLMFSEYYFYLMGIITDHTTREAFHKKNDPYPTIYRLDRIRSIEETGEKFSVPYKDRFKEGEYKNRTQFMFGGEPQKISFNYYGPSVEAVLDKFPMAKIVDKQEGACSIEAEVFGTGVKMWLLSQGSKVKVTAPETLVQEMKQEIERMNNQYK